MQLGFVAESPPPAGLLASNNRLLIHLYVQCTETNFHQKLPFKCDPNIPSQILFRQTTHNEKKKKKKKMSWLTIMSCMKRHKVVEEERQSVEDGIGDSTRSWSDLPPELLALIANRLGIIELLGFRGVCKDWRSASSSASADIESAVGIKPSFLVYSDKDQKGSFYYRTDGKIYRIHIPELENATCIASNHGWLLLLEQGSVFFFCPFSRARIDLPQLPVSEIPNPVAAFSTPPTSAECMISVANPCNNSKVELYVLNRGDSMWTKHEKSHPNQLGTITGALYFAEESSFYFLDSNRKVIKFSLKEKKFFHYRVVHASEDPYCDCLPFGYNVNYFTHCGLRTSMGLQDDASISTCGTRLPGNKYDTYVNNEKMEAPDGNANSQFKGIWIHARFFQVPPTQSWSL